jgi:hypothetical protein
MSQRTADYPVAETAQLGPAVITFHRSAPDAPAKNFGGYCLHTTATECRGGNDVPPNGHRLPAISDVVIDGHWWYFGRVPGRLRYLQVTPDVGAMTMYRAHVDGDDWFAVQLPDGATSASIQSSYDSGNDSGSGGGLTRRPAS